MNQKTQEKCPPMTFERRRTLTMTWDGLGEDDDDDQFFESFERLSSAVSLDLASSGSDDDEEYDDNRISFASAMSSATAIEDLQGFKPVQAASSLLGDYNMWTSEPGSIKERRRQLFQDMGLSSNKNLISVTSTKLSKIASKKVVPESGLLTLNNSVSPKKSNDQNPTSEESKQETSPSMQIVHVRSRSDGDIDTFSANTRRRKEELVGSISKQRLTRTSSTLTPQSGIYQYVNTVRVSPKRARNTSLMNNDRTSELPNGQFGAFFLIKDLDTGKEFIVKEFNDDGMWNRLSEVQTGKQLTMEEFEKSVGYSPVVKELMRRENVSRNLENERKVGANSYLSKSFRNSKRRGVALLKNIKGVANSISGSVVDKEKEQQQHINSTEDQQRNKNLTSKWIKARQQGKSIKEFTALHLCQEVQAHEGSIWTIRFSPDARYLASAGEDRVVHVWEVQECEVMSPKPNNDLSFAGMTASQEASAKLSSDQPSLEDVSPLPSERRKERPPLAGLSPMPSERKRKGKVSNKKKGNSIPHYVYVPETVFSLSEKPVCSFTGHLDDVLDLSWSKTQLLLSASMDKTVRLWDMETKSCLKLFAHNDYVTCIQFNPVDDNYFISGSLDAKVRLWSIPDRQLIDYTDMHEMVTAARYTPDGQGALIGSHKGSYRLYSTADCCLEQKDQIEIRHKKKSHAKKVTGFEFAPGNPSEVLVTSADSRIRIIDGSDIIHKFRGFRNTSSQISASFSANGKYVISASEDSQVYIWKRQELRNSGTGKSKGLITTYSHEHFQCKDVSVAIPWPGSIKNEPPIVEVHSKRHSKRFIPNPTFTTGSPAREGNPVGTSSRRTLPPLPKKNSDQEDLTQGSHHTCSEDGINGKRQLPPLQKRETISDRATSCHDEEHHQASRTDFENGTNSKRHLPPRPKKNSASERTTSSQDEDLAQNCRMNGVSEGAIHCQDEDLTQTCHTDSQARSSSKRQFPLFPKKNDVSERATSCNDEELTEVCRTNSEEGMSSKRQLPPTRSKKNTTLDRAMSCQDEDPTRVARTDSEIGIGESFTSGSSSIRYGGSPSISTSATSASQSWSSSWSILDGNSQGGHTVQATAWGMVIVTAGLGGEIRAYQNLGLPVKVGRQTNLFRDLT